MSNIFGFGSLNNDEESKEHDQSNRLYVGGASNHGGGSGLSVIAGDSASDANEQDRMQKIISKAKEQLESIASEETVNSRTITFYQNGFIVDDGPFRSLNDQSNKEFMDSLEKGIVPRELEGNARNEQVHVNLVDKRHEEYVPPKYTAYSGQGQTMGSTAPDAAAIISNINETSDGRPTVDSSQPTATFQIRLANGQRLRETLNLSHTIQDIQRILSSEGHASRPYVLMSGFPPKPLTNMQQTIEEAGLKGASISQKWA